MSNLLLLFVLLFLLSFFSFTVKPGWSSVHM